MAELLTAAQRDWETGLGNTVPAGASIGVNLATWVGGSTLNVSSSAAFAASGVFSIKLTAGPMVTGTYTAKGTGTLLNVYFNGTPSGTTSGTDVVAELPPGFGFNGLSARTTSVPIAGTWSLHSTLPGYQDLVYGYIACSPGDVVDISCLAKVISGTMQMRINWGFLTAGFAYTDSDFGTEVTLSGTAGTVSTTTRAAPPTTALLQVLYQTFGGGSGEIVVDSFSAFATPAVLTSFELTASSATIPAGNPIDVDVVALDQTGLPMDSYTGTATMTLSTNVNTRGGTPTIPDDVTFSGSDDTFSGLVFCQEGIETVTVTDGAVSESLNVNVLPQFIGGGAVSRARVRTGVTAAPDNLGYFTDASGNRAILKGLSLPLDYECLQSWLLLNYPTAGPPIYTGTFDPDDAIALWQEWGARCVRLSLHSWALQGFNTIHGHAAHPVPLHADGSWQVTTPSLPAGTGYLTEILRLTDLLGEAGIAVIWDSNHWSDNDYCPGLTERGTLTNGQGLGFTAKSRTALQLMAGHAASRPWVMFEMQNESPLELTWGGGVITNVESSGGTVTVTTAEPHGLVATNGLSLHFADPYRALGQSVGGSPPQTVASVPSSTTFTYSQPGAATVSSTATTGYVWSASGATSTVQSGGGAVHPFTKSYFSFAGDPTTGSTQTVNTTPSSLNVSSWNIGQFPDSCNGNESQFGVGTGDVWIMNGDYTTTIVSGCSYSGKSISPPQLLNFTTPSGSFSVPSGSRVCFGEMTPSGGVVHYEQSGRGGYVHGYQDSINDMRGIYRVSNVAQASTTATITTDFNHLLETGDEVTISGLTTTALNGTFTVTATPSATTFQFTRASATIASTPDSGTATGPLICSNMILISGGNSEQSINRITEAATMGAEWSDRVNPRQLGIAAHWYPQSGTAALPAAWDNQIGFASPITHIQVTGTTSVTLTTGTPHLFPTGSGVVVAGLANTALNGTWTTTGAPSNTTLTFTLSSPTTNVDVDVTAGQVGGFSFGENYEFPIMLCEIGNDPTDNPNYTATASTLDSSGVGSTLHTTGLTPMYPDVGSSVYPIAMPSNADCVGLPYPEAARRLIIIDGANTRQVVYNDIDYDTGDFTGVTGYTGSISAGAAIWYDIYTSNLPNPPWGGGAEGYSYNREYIGWMTNIIKWLSDRNDLSNPGVIGTANGPRSISACAWSWSIFAGPELILDWATGSPTNWGKKWKDYLELDDV